MDYGQADKGKMVWIQIVLRRVSMTIRPRLGVSDGGQGGVCVIPKKFEESVLHFIASPHRQAAAPFTFTLY